MKQINIDAISDTHRHHIDFTNDLSGGDLFIHAGDADITSEQAYGAFLKWLSKVSSRYQKAIFVPGNHDTYIIDDLEGAELDFASVGTELLINKLTTFEEYKIYGSPTSEAYGDTFTAFAGSEFEISKRLHLPSTDILITHGPPFGYCDSGYGSRAILEKSQQSKAKLHIFGHIHQGKGHEYNGETLYINVASAPANPIDDFTGPNKIFFDGSRARLAK